MLGVEDAVIALGSESDFLIIRSWMSGRVISRMRRGASRSIAQFEVSSFTSSQAPEAGLVILGDLSIQGNIKSVRSLAEPLQVAMDNGAQRGLVPLANKRNFLEVSGDIVERVDPIFFSDPMTAECNVKR